ncbi:MAG: DUF4920 domain-containing protein [Bacteroidota bacterium]
MKNILPLFALLVFLWSCETATDNAEAQGDEATVENATGDQASADKTADEEPEPKPKFELPDRDATGNFGAAVSAEGATDVGQLSTEMGEEDSVQIKLTGVVKAVCQARGCWMTLPLDGEKELMVKFKDYGFFVPRNSANKKATIEGWAYKEVVSVDELRHYAEDEGLPTEEIEKITEPKERLTFMADGVIIEE